MKQNYTFVTSLLPLNLILINIVVIKSTHSTGKSFSEALVLASTNPQYDKRLFVENCKLRTKTDHAVYKNCSACQNKNNLCT